MKIAIIFLGFVVAVITIGLASQAIHTALARARYDRLVRRTRAQHFAQYMEARTGRPWDVHQVGLDNYVAREREEA